ncbi:PREDICTED: transmembrane protein 217-like [Chinchilla lanigera]|uniref:transmembrane protein 217-like n=1 Tax=Chinchilla lanigera TaxID=34839 RepID=UPI00069808D9|nr:PREDICTED: transmembrane protein 217-like [Chinchilla lanigera]XP_013372500.1 PREDICTED: transmembrane protein 217-like [Chinchilla lanigera]
MDARKVTLLVGLFSILNTIQFFIFSFHQLTHLGYEDKFSLYLDTTSKVVSWLRNHKSKIISLLSVLTVAVSCTLLYSVHRDSYKGPLLYALWIVLYELTSFSLELLTGGLIRKRFQVLPRLYSFLQGSRMVLHFACLPSVLRHAYELFKAFKVVSKVGHRRRSSVSTLDSLQATGMKLMYRRLT